ncbi:MAG TPA: hypothetical protein VGL53_27350 [Bryobacteraceae bacterium]
MASTSETAAHRLLECCLTEEKWPPALLEDIRREVETLEGSRAFFAIVVERLADLFEPRLTSVYARMFSELIGRKELAARYERIRHPRVCKQNPSKVFVLSRVTLGADVAVTSVMLDAAKCRFPNAAIFYVGARKGWELFADDPRVLLKEVSYGRTGRLADRLAALPDLHDPDSIVIDPDSRLTQLGLLPVCDDESYYFFDSRAYGGESNATLTELAVRWCAETFEVADARPYIAPAPSTEPAARVTVSLGVGENPAKRLKDPFERELLASLPLNTLVDQGGSDDEARRVMAALKPGQRTFHGSFARFAAAIRESGFYVGYDSAGGHVASVCGVPLISIFAGPVCDRMFERWKPTGTVIRADALTPTQVLARTVATLKQFDL